MSKISLLQKIKDASTVKFDFDHVTTTKTKEGDVVAILRLTEPYPYVRGSQEVPFKNQRVALEANNFEEIKVHESNMNEDFVWDTDEEVGTYVGSELMLDVSKAGDVWLVKESYASVGNEMRTKSRDDKVSAFLKKNLERSGKKDLTPIVGA